MTFAATIATIAGYCEAVKIARRRSKNILKKKSKRNRMKEGRRGERKRKKRKKNKKKETTVV